MPDSKTPATSEARRLEEGRVVAHYTALFDRLCDFREGIEDTEQFLKWSNRLSGPGVFGDMGEAVKESENFVPEVYISGEFSLCEIFSFWVEEMTDEQLAMASRYLEAFDRDLTQAEAAGKP